MRTHDPEQIVFGVRACRALPLRSLPRGRRCTSTFKQHAAGFVTLQEHFKAVPERVCDRTKGKIELATAGAKYAPGRQPAF